MFDRLLGRRGPRNEPGTDRWSVASFSGRRLYDLPGGALLGITGERHHRAEVEATLKMAGVLAPEGLDKRASEVALGEHGRLRWFPVELIPTPDNPYDENAIEVRTTAGLVGYVDRDHAADFRPVFDLLVKHGYEGAVVAGFGRPKQNQIVLCISFADACARHLHEELVCRAAWDALHNGDDPAEVASRFEYANTGSLRRAVRAYARHHGLPDPETGRL